jgi:hypothetical protein
MNFTKKSRTKLHCSWAWNAICKHYVHSMLQSFMWFSFQWSDIVFERQLPPNLDDLALHKLLSFDVQCEFQVHGPRYNLLLLFLHQSKLLQLILSVYVEKFKWCKLLAIDYRTWYNAKHSSSFVNLQASSCSSPRLHIGGHSSLLLFGLAYQGKDIMFKFIIKYNSLKDFGP